MYFRIGVDQITVLVFHLLARTLKALIYFSSSLLVLVSTTVFLLILFEKEINLKAPTVKNYVLKKINENTVDPRIEIGSSRIVIGSEWSKIKIKFFDTVFINKNTSEPLIVKNIDVEFDFTSLLRLHDFQYSLTFSGIPIAIERNADKLVTINLDNRNFFSDNNTNKITFDSILTTFQNVKFIEVKNPEVTLYDLQKELALRVRTDNLTIEISDEGYFLLAQGSIPQRNLNYAPFNIEATYFRQEDEIDIVARAENVIPSQLKLIKEDHLQFLKSLDSPISVSVRTRLDKNKRLTSVSGQLSAQNVIIRDLRNRNNKVINNLFISYDMPSESSRIVLPLIEIETQYVKASGFGEVDFDSLLTGWLSFPRSEFLTFKKKRKFQEIHDSKIEFAFEAGTLRFENISFVLDKTRVNLAASLMIGGGVPKLTQFTLSASDVSPTSLNSIPFLKNNFSIMDIISNIKNFDVSINGEINESSKLNFAGQILFSEGSVKLDFFEDLILLKNGKINFSNDTFVFRVNEGHLQNLKKPNIRFRNIVVKRSKLKDNFNLVVSSNFTVVAEDPNFAFFLKKMKLGLPSDLKISKIISNNQLGGELSFDVKASDFNAFDVKSLTGSLSFEKLYFKIPSLAEPFSISTVYLEISKYNLVLKTTGTIKGTSIDGTFKKVFIDDVASTLLIRGKIDFSDFYPNFLTENILFANGAIAFTANFTFPPNQTPIVRLVADLTEVSFSVPFLGLMKEKDQPSNLSIDWDFEKLVNFNFDSHDYELFGTALLNNDYQIQNVEFSKLKLDAYFLGSAVYEIGEVKNTLKIDGLMYDYAKAPNYNSLDFKTDLEIEIYVSELKIRKSLVISDFIGSFYSNGDVYGLGSGQLNDGPLLQMTAEFDDSEQIFRIFSENAGEVLLESNIYSSGYGGEITVELTKRPKTDIEGNITVKNLRVIGAPFLAKLLSFTSIEGIIDGLSSNGIVFNNIQANYRFSKERLRIMNGVAVNPSFGITLSGTREMQQKMINYTGVLSPAYSLNGMVKRIPLIGSILGGEEGEGVFGMNYSAIGRINDPEITINPFSIIAPGQFRDFFN